MSLHRTLDNAMEPNLLRFLYRETTGQWLKILVPSIVAGTSRGLLLTTLNTAMATAVTGTTNALLFLRFACVLALYLACSYLSALSGRDVVEVLTKRLRIGLLDKLATSSLRFVESWGTNELHTCLGADISDLANAALTFVNALQAAALLILSLAYIGTLSQFGLAAALLVLVAGVTTSLWMDKHSLVALQRSRAKQTEYMQGMEDLLRGFKEVRQHQARMTELLEHIKNTLESYRSLIRTAQAQAQFSNLISEVYLFGLVTLLVFGMPMLLHGDRTVLFKLFACILFVMAPLESLLTVVPSFAAARVGLSNYSRLSQAIAASQSEGSPRKLHKVLPFTRITLEKIGFRFQGPNPEDRFSVGPIDLDVRRGEVLFIVGGNGAGKTTLLRLLCGLYTPDEGRILIDGQVLGAEDAQAYREMFAVVWSDFHLFRRLYGLVAPEAAEVEALLSMLQISHKTRLKDGRFVTTQLSTGQRKRLAFAEARLADRQVYVFDEFAADQDPAFRLFFYQELVPALRRQGKTVVAVTHDDRYVGVADRLVVMEYGGIAPAGDAIPRAAPGLDTVVSR